MGKEKPRDPPAPYKAESDLTDAERAELAALDIGTGAPVNGVVRRCLAETFSPTDWKEKKRDKASGVLWETRRSPHSGKEACRFTVTVAGANSGALQALLLDDLHLADTPATSSIYTFDKLIQRNHADRWLGRNVYVNCTNYKSPVWGVTPREMVVYLTLGALLTPAQQRQAGLPALAGYELPDAGGGKAEAAAEGPWVFAQCGYDYDGATPHATQEGYYRGHTHNYLHLGRDTPDGLHYTFAIDIDPAGSIPARVANIANDEQFKKAITIAGMLKALGRKPNRAAVYENTFDFDPLAHLRV